VAGEHILIVDDEQAIQLSLRGVLEDEAYRVTTVGTGADALRLLADEAPDLVFLDIWMPGLDGLATLTEIRRLRPEPAVIMISGHATIETAVKATRLGAYDFIEKPLSLEKVLLAVTHALERTRLARENESLKARLDRRFEITGESPGIRALRDQIALAAPTMGRVLIHGENGSGKELAARAIHALSARADRAFVEVNCAAIPEELIESELFGHERGAFTGALARRRGRFELADGGTVFLDEVAEMPLSMQAKLLRFLQTGEIRPVGSGSTHVVDVRLVAATNKPLEQEVRRGAFREDLYYRLAVIPLEVPPLRSRLDDVPLLARHFLRRVTERWGRPPLSIDESALDALMAYHWPGNVRELENAIERAVALCPGERVRAEDLPLGGGASLPREATTAPESLPSLERRHILETLERVGWNRKLAAELLQISTTTLWRRLKEFGIDTHTRGRRWVGEPGAS
jgi:two-component system nitrogen regulation response regulator NtrX